MASLSIALPSCSISIVDGENKYDILKARDMKTGMLWDKYYLINTKKTSLFDIKIKI